MSKCRCNNCMKVFKDDDEFELLKDEQSNEFYKGCPSCKTDSYLMDL
ncbi:hypothetical protein [Bacillus tropicus]|nr:hypothetical protein [Bacillus tropicus]